MTQQAEPQIKRVVFRVPQVGLLAALLLAAGATPFAFGAPGLWLIYLVPLAVVVFVLRTRTVADPAGLVARTVFGRTEIAWGELRGLRVRENSWVRAVLTDDREVTLPAVRVRSLSLLSAVSGGVIPDPDAAPAEPEPEPEDETESDQEPEPATDRADRPADPE